MGPVERPGVAVPHVGGELQQLLEAAEAFRSRFERQADHGGLVGVVAGADAEPGSAAGEHVEGGDGLDQQRGRADRRPGDHRAEPHRIGGGGEEPEGGVGLEHRFVDAGGGVHLQEVVGDPEGVHPGLVDRSGQVHQVRGDVGRPAGPGVVGDGDAELHGCSTGVSAKVGCRAASAAMAASVERAVTPKWRRTNIEVPLAR